MRAFDDLLRSGKVGYAGCSTKPAWMMMEVLSNSEREGWNSDIGSQPSRNLLNRSPHPEPSLHDCGPGGGEEIQSVHVVEVLQHRPVPMLG